MLKFVVGTKTTSQNQFEKLGLPSLINIVHPIYYFQSTPNIDKLCLDVKNIVYLCEEGEDHGWLRRRHAAEKEEWSWQRLGGEADDVVSVCAIM